MKSKGFTLIELMVTVAVATIAMMVAVPNMNIWIQNNRAAAQANTLISSINQARQEAITRGLSVSICPSTDNATCSGSTTWSNGWIIFTDSVDPAGAVNTGDAVLYTAEKLQGNSTLTSNKTYIQFLGTGFSGYTDTSTFSLAVPKCTGPMNRSISVAPSGKVSVSTVSC